MPERRRLRARTVRHRVEPTGPSSRPQAVSAWRTTLRLLLVASVGLAFLAGCSEDQAADRLVTLSPPDWAGTDAESHVKVGLVGDGLLLAADERDPSARPEEPGVVTAELIARGDRVSTAATPSATAATLSAVSYPGDDPDLLLVAVGTNDLLGGVPRNTPDLIVRAMQAVGPRVGAPCSVLVTVAEVVPGAARLNDAIRYAAAADPRLALADWAAEVARRPGLVTSGGQALTPEGEDAYAQLIVDRLTWTRPTATQCEDRDPDAGIWGTVDDHFVGTGRRVLLLGDSLTVLSRKETRAVLDDHALKIAAWTGEGFTGGKMSDFDGKNIVLDAAFRTLASHEPPEVLVVAIGTNDAWVDPEPAPGRPDVADVEQDLAALVRAVPDVCTVVVTITESGPDDYDDLKATAVNDLLRAHADVVVDWNTLGAGTSYTASDLIHPTPAGVLHRSELLAQAVRSCPS